MLSKYSIILSFRLQKRSENQKNPKNHKNFSFFAADCKQCIMHTGKVSGFLRILLRIRDDIKKEEKVLKMKKCLES